MFARRPVKLESVNTDLPGIVYASGELDLHGALARHGALLLRGLNLQTVADFETVDRAISPRLIEYGERSSPRTRRVCARAISRRSARASSPDA